MRDILTALAFLVILILTAALLAPPFVDWETRRGDLEAALSRAAGAPVEARGEIDLRLLPSPRLRVDGLTLGIPDGDALSLVAQEVSAEIELMSLLRGEVRFHSVAMARADLRIPMEAETLRLPDELISATDTAGAWSLEDLRVGELGVTAISPELGARRLAAPTQVTVSAQSPAGPWRVEGMLGDQPFRLATGRIDPDGQMQIKLVGGGDTPIRYDTDGLLRLIPDGERHRAELTGSARITATPPAGEGEDAAALILQTEFASEAAGFALRGIGIEFDDPALGSRLEGEGFLRLDDPRLSLTLDGRRLAADAILSGATGRLLREQLAARDPNSAHVPLDLSLTLGSIGYAREELLDVALDVTLEEGIAQVRRAQITLPGDSRLEFSGDVDPGDLSAIDGAVRLQTRESDRLARFLSRVGADGPWMSLLDGQALDLAGMISLRPDAFAISDLSVSAGESVLRGEITYREAQAGGRGLVDARIVADGIDVANLPRFDLLSGIASDTDLALAVEASAVRFEGDEGAGRIDARLSSEGSTIIVDRLDITDLAGATVAVSGRIAEDGGGLISGRLSAARAAPLLELLGRFRFDGLVDAAPEFLRQGSVDLALAIERVPAARGLDTAALRTSVEGEVAGGPFRASSTSIGGRLEAFSISLATEDTRRWLDLDHPMITGRPSTLALEMRRSGADRFALEGSGDIAGLRLRATRPLSIDAVTREVWDGEVSLSSADVRPALALFGQSAGSAEATPADFRFSISREESASVISLTGRLAEDRVQGRFRLGSGAPPQGELSVDYASLPWIINTLALGIDAGEEPSRWSSSTFGPITRPVREAEISLTASRMGLAGEASIADASATIAVTPDGMSMTGLSGRYADGQIAGDLTIRRTDEGGAAVVGELSFADLALSEIAPETPFSARLTGMFDFGGSGETVSEIIQSLAGGGSMELASLALPAADPGAIARGLDRALQDEDPLGGRRLQGLVEEELAAGSLTVEEVTAPVTLVGGVLRLEPLELAPGPDAAATWSGSAAFDLASARVDIRGLMRAREAPVGWSGAPPTITLGWSGPIGAPTLNVDVGPLTNGVASIVLQRELERIEAFEREANERARRIEQLRMEQAREAEAARWAEVLRVRAEEEEERRRLEEEEAARLAEEERLQAEAEAARLAEERRVAEERRLQEEEARREQESQQALEEMQRSLEREREALRRILEGEEPEGDAVVEPLSTTPMQILPPGFAPR